MTSTKEIPKSLLEHGHGEMTVHLEEILLRKLSGRYPGLLQGKRHHLLLIYGAGTGSADRKV